MTEDNILDPIIEDLRKHAQKHYLCIRAEKNFKKWIDSEGILPDNLQNLSITFEFRSHSLCFRHGLLSYPFVTTHYALLCGKDEIGYYKLITTLEGIVDDDYFVIYDRYEI